MRIKKLWILACLAGVSCGISAPAQPATSGNDDQDKALQALRQAESPPSTNSPAVDTTTPAPAPVVKSQPAPDDANVDSDKEVKEALAEKARIQREAQDAAATRNRQLGELELKPETATPNAIVAAAVATPPTVAPDTTAPSASDAVTGTEDQTRALQALRRAEAVVADNQAVPAAPPPAAETASVATVAPATVVETPAAPAPAAEPAPTPAAPAPVAESPAIAVPPPAAETSSNAPVSQIVAPEPAITSVPVAPVAPAVAPSSEDQARALEALRRAEAAVVVTNQISPAPAASALPLTPEIQNRPMTVQDKEAQLIEAQRQRKALEEKARADLAAQAAAAEQQKEQDDLKLKQAIEAEKAAAEQARLNQQVREEAARKQKEEDDLKLQQAIEAERVAAEQARIAQAQEEAAAAARKKAEDDAARKKAEEAAAARQKAQEETARRIQKLNKETQNAAATGTNTMSSKEKRLGDLLRLYETDQITPYEYHVQRAKIIAEP